MKSSKQGPVFLPRKGPRPLRHVVIPGDAISTPVIPETASKSGLPTRDPETQASVSGFRVCAVARPGMTAIVCGAIGSLLVIPETAKRLSGIQICMQVFLDPGQSLRDFRDDK
jgi:hypothetical protein